MRNEENHMKLIFDAKSVNEAFARMSVAAFMSAYNPTLDQIEDVKTAVSEAVTNSVVHAYKEDNQTVELECTYKEGILRIIVRDYGVGITNISQAMQPFYTSKPELERSGMGFMFMETFMDTLDVLSQKNEGTEVIMSKRLNNDGYSK